MVATVFDFRNEMRDPNGRWPLGESEESYKYIDLLAVDWDEARRLSGEEELERNPRARSAKLRVCEKL